MKIKNIVIYAAMLALGVTLHALTPGFLGNMKPDFLLATFFICIVIAPSFTDVIVISIGCGILAAMTTAIPGGEIPNIIDKLITGPTMYLVFKQIKEFNKLPIIGCFSLVGTMLSGTMFLLGLMIIGTLPAGFTSLFITVVIPAAIANMIFFSIFYKAYYRVRLSA